MPAPSRELVYALLLSALALSIAFAWTVLTKVML